MKLLLTSSEDDHGSFVSTPLAPKPLVRITKLQMVCNLRTCYIYSKECNGFLANGLYENTGKEHDVLPYLETWYESVKKSNWTKLRDTKKFYATLSILKGSRVVFNIKGNSYRQVAKINYEKSWLFIRFIRTNKKYDIINAEEM